MIRGARQLVTLRGPRGPRRGAELNELGVIPDGSLLIHDSVIREIGPSRRVENLAAARGAIEINATGRVVMPGFVDSHTHLVYPPAGPELEEGSAARAVRATTGQRWQRRAQASLNAMARHGTTTVEAKTGCGPDEAAEMKILRVLAALKDDPLHVVPTFLFRLPKPGGSGALCAEAADRVIRELMPKFHRRRFVRFADLAWDPGPAAQDIFRRYLNAARRLGLPCKIHADQSTAGAVAMAVEHLAVSIDHLERATAQEVAALGGSSTMATLLPEPPFCGGECRAPARHLIEAGVAVALATNFNPHDTPALNMQTLVALACMCLAMTPEEAISAATINGAHALGYGDRVGSLEIGKLADLLILNIGDYRELAHHFGMNLVHITMRRGNVIYKEGDVVPHTAEEFCPVRP